MQIPDMFGAQSCVFVWDTDKKLPFITILSPIKKPAQWRVILLHRLMVQLRESIPVLCSFFGYLQAIFEFFFIFDADSRTNGDEHRRIEYFNAPAHPVINLIAR